MDIQTIVEDIRAEFVLAPHEHRLQIRIGDWDSPEDQALAEGVIEALHREDFIAFRIPVKIRRLYLNLEKQLWLIVYH